MSKYSLASQGDLELEKALLGLDGDGLPITTGNKYFVIPVADSNYNAFYKKFQETYDDGTQAVHNTIASAYSAVTSNRHDIIFLSANAAHAQTSMLTIAKSRVHFVGMSMRSGRTLGMGARTRVTMGATLVATDIAVLLNTGVGNTFDSIKFDNGNDKAESLYSVVESGEYAVYRNCEFYNSDNLDIAGSAELVANGDSSQFIDCYIGSTANEIVGAIVRPCVLGTKSIAPSGTKQLRDNVFIDCVFARKGGNAANRFVAGANADDVGRMLMFKGCTFFNNILGTANPGAAIDFTTAQTAGNIFLDSNCAVVAVTVMGTTGESIYVISQDGSTYATAGLAVAA